MEPLIRKYVTAGAGALLLVALWLAVPHPGQAADPASTRTILAVVKDVTFTSLSKDEVIGVILDRPFAYSFYPLTNPLRVVVDLASADPGAYTKPLSYQGGLVKEVRFARHGVASGLMTRMEILLAEGTDFSVKLAPEDQRKLILTFEANQKKQALTVPTISAPAGKLPDQKPAGITAAAVTKPAVVPEKIAPLAGTSSAPATPGKRGRNLTKIAVTPEGIDIFTDGPVGTYSVFFMTNPNRMVIDLPGVRNGISAAKLPIRSFNIDSARLGKHEGKSRIVFEGASDAVLRCRLVKTETGLRVLPAGTAHPEPDQKGAAAPGSPLK